MTDRAIRACRRIIGVSTISLLVGCGSLAAGAANPVAGHFYDSGGLELRAGYLLSVITREHGTGNVDADVVLPFLRGANVTRLLLPRWQIGATANLRGRTSFVYTGPLWTFDYSPRGFAELFVGGMVHNGQLRDSAPGLSRLGCRELYQVGFDLGYRLAAHSSLMLTFDHGSNGEATLSRCPANEGLDVFGLRVGYRF